MGTNATTELSKKFDVLAAKVDDQDNRISELERENQEKDAEIEDLKERIEKDYKYAEIKVLRVPNTCQATLNDLTRSIFTVLKLPNELADVYSVRELKSRTQVGGPSGPVSQPGRWANSLAFCIRFKSTCVRDSVLQTKRSFGQLKFGQIYTGGGEAIIELHEMLSPYVHKLRLAAKARATTAGFKYVWANGNRVMVRKTDGSEAMSIITNQDIGRMS